MATTAEIDPAVAPSGTGCVECDAAGGWWFHLRSFEPGETWYWSFETEQYYDGPELADPQAHPDDQDVPGPAGRVPADWQRHLH